MRDVGHRLVSVFITVGASAISVGVGEDESAGTDLSGAYPGRWGGASFSAQAPRGKKTGMVLALLGRQKGALRPELPSATGSLPHTLRAALTGLRKRGHVIDRCKRDGVWFGTALPLMQLSRA